ncbi:manganese efflux pump MntP family protein [Gorillibacterium massiliense]|uniref:manganese efflux pump MntP n=1 Tax=Gorillibacterium massiliense TaxID=1280390 RepID=UPI0004B6A0D6|nr:manganese efflux pump [Gorillibacterium massiliense]
MLALPQMGQLFTILIMAAALGMDAFSLGVGVGIRGIRFLDAFKMSFVIGLFHIFMPLGGMVTGHYLGELLGNLAVLAGGGLLALLGGHMIYSSIRGGAVRTIDHRTPWGMLIFALSVSIDSFSVGVSLGIFASDVALTVLIFGFFGGLMSIMGLLLGRRASQWAGDYGEALGGLILLAFGIKFLF